MSPRVGIHNFRQILIVVVKWEPTRHTGLSIAKQRKRTGRAMRSTMHLMLMMINTPITHVALSWAHEAATTSLRVNLFDPGIVATRMRADAMPGEDRHTLAQPADIAPALADLCEPGETRHGEIIRL